MSNPSISQPTFLNRVLTKFGEQAHSVKQIAFMVLVAASLVTVIIAAWVNDKPMLGRFEMNAKEDAIKFGADNRIVGGARKAFPLMANKAEDQYFPVLPASPIAKPEPPPMTPATVSEMTQNGCYHQQLSTDTGLRVKTFANR